MRCVAGCAAGAASGAVAVLRKPTWSLCHRNVASSSKAGGSGTGSGDGGSFFGALRGLYRDFQLYQDRKLDAELAAEAQEGVTRLYRASDGGTSSRTASSSSGAAAAAAGIGAGQLGGVHSPEHGSLHISRNPSLCPRSVLFVPASKPRALAKIPTLSADCFILDLEDSVAPGSKRQARENIRAFVEELQQERRAQRGSSGGAAVAAAGADAVDAVSPTVADLRGGYPRLVIRINSPDYDSATAMLDLQLVGLLGPTIEGVAVPKTTVRTHQLIKDYVFPEHQLWAFFESPRSVMEAPLICRQGVYRYAVMGHNDLGAELQLPMTASSPLSHLAATPGSRDELSDAAHESLYIASRLPLWQSTVQVLLAARAHQMFVVDAVFNDPTDKAGFRRSVQECRQLGLDGKTLIHPEQIEPTNAAYTPAEAAVAWAQRVVEAVQRSGGGVATVDGKMVEELHQRQALQLLALHRSAQMEMAATAASVPATDATTAAAGDVIGDAAVRQPRRTPSRHRPVS
ncbi:HpcH/HpaI aldolase/citrate lyase family [Novymonas esmeraldas]|uniref:HpcH/HpaI aldolase/citrate lyase family n=1 Tax=Novymonas esmeraldas TaxID=1808958 RepID=A0AAW0EN96_9TRYP